MYFLILALLISIIYAAFKYKIDALFPVLFVFIVLVVYSVIRNINPSDIAVEQRDILKTVAHIDLSNRVDLELIAMDNYNDVAYYKYVDPEYNINIGDTVYLVGGATAVVVSSDAVGFTLNSDDIVEGMSGTAVTTQSGKQIGFISSRLPDGTYRCIWS